MRWIPVSEHVPPDLRDVCVCGMFGYGRLRIRIAHYDSAEGRWFSEDVEGALETVTHWLPIPRIPPQSKELEG